MNVIIYCSDIELLKQELVANGYWDEELQDFIHGNELTPIKKNSIGASLSYVMNNKLDLALFPSLQSLGDYDDMFATPDSLALYKSVYPYDVPIVYIEDDGSKHNHLRPIRIGVFC